MKPKLKPPGIKRLKLKCDKLLSSFAFKFNLRRYNVVVVLNGAGTTATEIYLGRRSVKVGRCRLNR